MVADVTDRRKGKSNCLEWRRITMQWSEPFPSENNSKCLGIRANVIGGELSRFPTVAGGSGLLAMSQKKEFSESHVG